ncbi:capsular polysaccharide biosynthesis protein Cps4B [Streptococcus hillyeri]|uniref:Tyrosine-protein phosphatase n=1 Tax=Streptococcus hillyeri TaxID=2282420 RepID=A0A3L9DLJ0_9STRE|nr:capsular polysaccharide biosynthesis protein Cps4B [Streptococcus hillyeri]RLY02131.1 tyrosine protein phosphatase [Streptococcus hillyeri]
MIDIHSHIIFGVDDGPETLEESIELIKEAYRQGVRTIVATSHRRKGMFETPEVTILSNFIVLQEEIKELLPEMTLLYGGELYFTTDIIAKLEKQTIPTMNGTRFALVEFSTGTPWKTIHGAVTDLLNIGITPVVAHIERYNALENRKDRVKELIDLGCYTQINSSHVLKAKLFGDKYKVFKKRATYFLEENLVHCVASDMHNLDNRKPYMKEAYVLIEKRFGTKKARQLFHDNQKILLANQFI